MKLTCAPGIYSPPRIPHYLIPFFLPSSRQFHLQSLSTMPMSSVSTFIKTPFSVLQGFHKFSTIRSVSRVSTRFCFLETMRFSSTRQLKPHRICSTIGNGDASDISDVHKSSADQEGSKENNGIQHTKTFTFNESMKRLRRYGTSGMLSYGLLNTAYYLTTFLFVWFYVVPTPGRMGYAAAVERFLKLMAMVWAGSQVTKLVRVAGALALAPVVDRGLSWFTIKFKFQSQAKAFMAIVGVCFGMALVLFFVVTLLCA